MKKGSIVVENIRQKLNAGISSTKNKNEYEYYIKTLKIKRIFDFLTESYKNIIPLYLYIDSDIFSEKENIKREFKSILIDLTN